MLGKVGYHDATQLGYRPEVWIEKDALLGAVIADLIRGEIEGLIDPEHWTMALESERQNRSILAKASENWATVEKSIE